MGKLTTELVGMTPKQQASRLSELTIEQLNTVALDLLEDRPRRLWALVQAERTKRFRAEELARSNLARQISGISDDELAALRQDVKIADAPNTTAVMEPGG